MLLVWAKENKKELLDCTIIKKDSINESIYQWIYSYGSELLTSAKNYCGDNTSKINNLPGIFLANNKEDFEYLKIELKFSNVKNVNSNELFSEDNFIILGRKGVVIYAHSIKEEKRIKEMILSSINFKKVG